MPAWPAIGPCSRRPEWPAHVVGGQLVTDRLAVELVDALMKAGDSLSPAREMTTRYRLS